MQETIGLKSVALSNGYNPNIIDKLIKKKRSKLDFNIRDHTFLEPESETKSKPLILPHNMSLCKGLDKIFNRSNLKIVYKNNNSLKRFLGSAKDKIDNLDKSGIYKFSCNQCNATYIGQSRRKIKTRAKDHLNDYRLFRHKKSAVADHMFLMNEDITNDNDKHMFNFENLELLKEVNDPLYLDAWESRFIHEYKNRDDNLTLNKDNGKIPSDRLFSLIC